MDSTITASTNGDSWVIAPTNKVAVFIHGVFFRNFMFVLTPMDLIIGWLRLFDPLLTSKTAQEPPTITS